MSDILAALDLLDSIAFRDRIDPDEKLPVWRAIKLLYRAGIPEADCRHMVEQIRCLGSKRAFGPSLVYHMQSARLMVERMGEEPDPPNRVAQDGGFGDERQEGAICNRARYLGEPETLVERFGAKWLADRPMDNRFNPQELVPRGRAWVIRENDRGRGVDFMPWDVMAGHANFPMTNVRQLGLPRWKNLAAKPDSRCLVPLTEFCEWAPEATDLGDGKKPVRGEMWFACIDQPIFAVAGFWQDVGDQRGFAMVTCDPNPLVAPIHPKAMITILHEADWDRWLRGSYDDVVALQQPYPADRMTVRGPVFPTRSKAK